MEQQKYLDEFLENKLSPTMWMSVNPNYRMENKMDMTQFKATHTGQKDEPTDKVYFRKKDEIIDYAEAMFRSKILINKK